MSRLDPKSLETAFLPPGTPSLADCLTRIEEAEDLTPIRRRDLLSGLRRLASALGRPPALLPADLTWLQPRIEGLEPATLGLTPKTWSNVLSNARAGLLHCGIVESRMRRIDDLSPLWQPLWQDVVASGKLTLTTTLGRLIRFLDNLQVAPADVCHTHMEQYREALALNELRRAPEEGARQATYAWNRATKLLESWPKQTLPMAKSDFVYGLPLSTFPESFAEDLAKFVQRLENPELLNDSALTAPLRPATVRHRRGQILRFASVLVHAGVEPSEISSLKALVTPTLAKRGLAWLHARQGSKKGPGLADVAIMLKTLARHHVPCSTDDLKEIVGYSNWLALPRQDGLTAKNRERLRPFEDPALRRRLLNLPTQLLERTKGKSGQRAALMREEALAISLLLHCPIRLRNLVNLHLEHHLRRMGDGKVFLVYHGSEVKNRRVIDIELAPAVLEMLDAHLATRSPELCPPGTLWLFPRRDGAASIEPSHLSKRISARIRKEIGLEMHVHLFRHFAAKMFLEAHPGEYEAVRQLLGHAALSSTLSAYTGFEAATAIRRYNEVLTQAQQGAR